MRAKLHVILLFAAIQSCGCASIHQPRDAAKGQDQPVVASLRDGLSSEQEAPSWPPMPGDESRSGDLDANTSDSVRTSSTVAIAPVVVDETTPTIDAPIVAAVHEPGASQYEGSSAVGVVSASSGTGDYAPHFAVDGDTETRWSSDFSDEEWWQIAFNERRRVNGIRILWETAFGEEYRIRVSDDGDLWRTVYHVKEGDGQTDFLFFEPVDTRYLRIQGTRRGTGWGYSIWDVDFFLGEQRPRFLVDDYEPDQTPSMAMDGDESTEWRTGLGGEATFFVRLPGTFELGGLRLLWGDLYASAYAVDVSVAGSEWKTVFEKEGGNGADDHVFFTATRADSLRIRCLEPGSGTGYALREMEFKGGEEQATPLRKIKAVAQDLRKGWFPMWLGRVQEFWTIAGVVGDYEESLLGETGTIEPFKGGFHVLPVVMTDKGAVTWADVELGRKLAEDYLPLPSVQWSTDTWNMDISLVPVGEPGESSMLARYRIQNAGSATFRARLALLLRPVQLNPVWQRGGLGPMYSIECISDSSPQRMIVNKLSRFVSLTKPVSMGAAPFAEGDLSIYVEKGMTPAASRVIDAEGLANAAAMYELDIPPGEYRDVIVAFPLHENSSVNEELVTRPASTFEVTLADQADTWRKLLNRFSVNLPNDRLLDVLKSNIAYILLNQDGPWIKPGPRNYNHAWIRDGAMTSAALLRMGLHEQVKNYIDAFSQHVAKSGWVPFMILENGHPILFNAESHEGHEYDSQGQYPFLLRHYYDYTRDEEYVREKFPLVVSALRFARELRKQRLTDAYEKDPALRPFYGILPESNSHEGYFPAKHSYWDDFWVIKGLKDGAYLADQLGFPDDAAWMRAEEEALRIAVTESMLAVIQSDGLDHLPGCAELGDFDATSTAIAVMACDEADRLLQPYATQTFDKYYEHFLTRLQPGGETTFTPYEVRTADVFVRLGQREKALTMLEHFSTKSTHPYEWNHLAEVVHERPRAPSYLGDMPHTWVGSGFISAVRSMFAYERRNTLVLAAGLRQDWLFEGVEAKHLATQFGPVRYRIGSKDGRELTISVGGTARPSGGFSVALPPELHDRRAEIDGLEVAIEHGEVHFDVLPAEIRIR